MNPSKRQYKYFYFRNREVKIKEPLSEHYISYFEFSLTLEEVQRLRRSAGSPIYGGSFGLWGNAQFHKEVYKLYGKEHGKLRGKTISFVAVYPKEKKAVFQGHAEVNGDVIEEVCCFMAILLDLGKEDFFNPSRRDL